MFIENYKILSPAIINAEFDQCHWKQMYNWNYQYVRAVKWIDFQCPMFHIDFIELQHQFPKELILGWGQDVLSGINCEEWDMKIGVIDMCTITHLNSQTIKKNANSNDRILKNYNQLADKYWHDYIHNNINLTNKIHEFRHWGETYDTSN
jgi:hypothetical protein